MKDWNEQAALLLMGWEQNCSPRLELDAKAGLLAYIAAALEKAAEDGQKETRDYWVKRCKEQMDLADELRAEVAKLTAERDMSNRCVERWEAEAESRVDEVIQAHAERDAAVAAHCGTCDGSGVVDSGGVTPWDAPIDIACPECKAKHNAAVVQGLEIAREIVATGNIDKLSDAIAAEIAKCKGEPV